MKTRIKTEKTKSHGTETQKSTQSRSEEGPQASDLSIIVRAMGNKAPEHAHNTLLEYLSRLEASSEQCPAQLISKTQLNTHDPVRRHETPNPNGVRRRSSIRLVIRSKQRCPSEWRTYRPCWGSSRLNAHARSQTLMQEVFFSVSR